MHIKHKDLVIDKDDPFKNCMLDRKKYALALTEIVKQYSDGFVLAINNEWGTGKTTFVKMWQQQLKAFGFHTIYFNAWENDLNKDPLVAIISELKTLIDPTSTDGFQKLVEKGAALIKNVAPALLKAATKKYLGDVTGEVVENTAKTAVEFLEEEIKQFSVKKKSIVEFKTRLEAFVFALKGPKPLIFIVDELDRCQPFYAIEVLEKMKHFFSVPGIVFTLSIDKKHLASSVKGFYGSEQINTDEYLRRFIDLEYSIPPPENEIFCRYLFDYFSFNEFFKSADRSVYDEFRNDSQTLLMMIELLFGKYKPTLRQQEKIIGRTRLIIKLFDHRQYVFAHLLFFLIFIKEINNVLYEQIRKKNLTVQELSNAFFDIIDSNSFSPFGINLLYVEALLLQFYNNCFDYGRRETLLKYNDDGKSVATIESKLEAVAKYSSLQSCLDSIQTNMTYSNIELSYLLNKIDLYEFSEIA
ncbi:MAG: hypothetical protein J0H92_20765 [Sphingobacteriales bacterium]|nr:hypothetical protein [Sphingobacteriales bacterium]OJW31888.1 MAG: hypothetical protein BGO54_15750 [Sphingobacteriales bacterium 46-32]